MIGKENCQNLDKSEKKIIYFKFENEIMKVHAHTQNQINTTYNSL